MVYQDWRLPARSLESLSAAAVRGCLLDRLSPSHGGIYSAYVTRITPRTQLHPVRRVRAMDLHSYRDRHEPQSRMDLIESVTLSLILID
jgi:hypothetical protein